MCGWGEEGTCVDCACYLVLDSSLHVFLYVTPLQLAPWCGGFLISGWDVPVSIVPALHTHRTCTPSDLWHRCKVINVSSAQLRFTLLSWFYQYVHPSYPCSHLFLLAPIFLRSINSFIHLAIQPHPSSHIYFLFIRLFSIHPFPFIHFHPFIHPSIHCLFIHSSIYPSTHVSIPGCDAELCG